VQDNHCYPYFGASSASSGLKRWEDYLEPYYKPGWTTNPSYQCPSVDLPYGHLIWPHVLYAYNRSGTDELGGEPGANTFLGLGNTENDRDWIPPISESQLKVPSEMFAISDSRIYHTLPGSLGIWGSDDFMACGLEPLSFTAEIRTPRHGKGYNVVFCDGHVVLVARPVLFDPSKSAVNWNNDYQPHSETWLTAQ
jgi:prepilin-type processing-associated H-X9-DG protein